MDKIENEKKEQENENAKSLEKLSHHKNPTRSVKLKTNSDIETKSGDFQDIEDGEEDEFIKKNNEIIKYKHIKNTKNKINKLRRRR